MLKKFLLLTLVLLPVSNAVADARLQALFSLGATTDFFQDIDFTQKGPDLKGRSGSGILFDWAMKTPDSILSGGMSGHAVGIDFYSIGEEEGEESIQNESLLVGYRYHFLSRFYVGASIGLLSDLEWDCGPEGQVSAEANPLAYTLGYAHSFPFGLILGVHYLGTLATDYELENPSAPDTDKCGLEDQEDQIEDVEVRLIGATLGFSF